MRRAATRSVKRSTSSSSKGLLLAQRRNYVSVISGEAMNSAVYQNDKRNKLSTPSRTDVQVKGDPYDWPFDGGIDLDAVALVCIDFQRDFVEEGGYVSHMGYDLKLVRKPIPYVQKLLKLWREMDLRVVHTREGHDPDLTDCPPNKLWRSKRIHGEIGSSGPDGRILIRGEKGWGLIDELAPDLNRHGKEAVVDKPSKGAFTTTNIHLILKCMGIRQLVFTGVTTDVCVHTIMREANDLGYECLILEDCTGATNQDNHNAAIHMVKMQGGVFGSVSDSTKLIAALEQIQKDRGMVKSGSSKK